MRDVIEEDFGTKREKPASEILLGEQVADTHVVKHSGSLVALTSLEPPRAFLNGLPSGSCMRPPSAGSVNTNASAAPKTTKIQAETRLMMHGAAALAKCTALGALRLSAAVGHLEAGNPTVSVHRTQRNACEARFG